MSFIANSAVECGPHPRWFLAHTDLYIVEANYQELKCNELSLMNIPIGGYTTVPVPVAAVVSLAVFR